MRNAENEFYANRRFAIHLIRRSHGRIGTSTSKNYKCDICMAKADDRDFNLKETKKVIWERINRTVRTAP